jgi:hypothetical protein
MTCLSADNPYILLDSLVLIHGVCFDHRDYAHRCHLWLLRGRREGGTREQYNPTGTTVEGVRDVRI